MCSYVSINATAKNDEYQAPFPYHKLYVVGHTFADFKLNPYIEVSIVCTHARPFTCYVNVCVCIRAVLIDCLILKGSEREKADM